MLGAELAEQAVLEAAQGGVLLARDGNGRGLVARRVHLDLMLERVVVDVVCLQSARLARRPGVV